MTKKEMQKRLYELSVIKEIRSMLRKDSEDIIRVIEQTDLVFYTHFPRIDFIKNIKSLV